MGLQNMVKKEIPSFIQDRIEQQCNRTSRTSVYSCLGCLHESCWNNASYCTERGLDEISIGRWFRTNDTTSDSFMFGFGNNFSTNLTKIEIFYNFISQENAFLDSVNCFLNDRKSGLVIIGFLPLTSESINLPNYSMTNYCVSNITINITANCGLLPAINTVLSFVKSCFGDKSNETVTIVIYHDHYYIDFSSTADVILTLLMLLKDFMANHLIKIFQNVIQSADNNKSIITLSQKDLALGYRIGDRKISGILPHHLSMSQAYLDDPPITVSTCLDGRNVKNNMVVRGK
ncbi:hypothetical protein CHS0354_034628 [Potamilus streckersoni]|uniref:Uncharacterized protein n=1 Tax=Potamilus streckersoni TaxID=2493646 RepID=A0AAE0STK2_9BIVA|nr:hypothetical protein CHS0354_034628 [Potamilus streckersoni]